MLRADRTIATETYDIYDTADAKAGMVMDPRYRLSERDAQALFDDLYHAGLRPSETRSAAGRVEATEKHLDHVSRLLDQCLPVVLRHAMALMPDGS
jgi:hypothetical protein